jgi:hypothetical protein
VGEEWIEETGPAQEEGALLGQLRMCATLLLSHLVLGRKGPNGPVFLLGDPRPCAG